MANKQVVGKIAKKRPAGHIAFLDKQGRAKAAPMRWNKRSKGRKALGGDVVKRAKGFLYYIKGINIMRVKMARRGRGRRSK